MGRQSTIDAFLGSKISRKPLPRSVSSESTLSCITLNNDIPSAADVASTPPTSIDDSSSLSLEAKRESSAPAAAPELELEPGSTSMSARKGADDDDQAQGRSRRARTSVASYNENILIKKNTRPSVLKRTAVGRPSPSKQERDRLVQDGISALDLDWQIDALPGDKVGDGDNKDAKLGATGARSKSLLRKASAAIDKTKTILGKRTREILDAGKSGARDIGRRASLRARDVLDKAAEGGKANKASSSTADEPHAKRRRLGKDAAHAVSSEPPQLEMPQDEVESKKMKPTKERTKRWLGQGLYVGQEQGFDPRLKPGDNSKRSQKNKAQAKRPSAYEELFARPRKMLPLPMFAGRRLMEAGRDFKMPFEVFNPLPPGQPRPDEWRRTMRNVFVGDAAEYWKFSKKMEYSTCICTKESGCGEDCFNRFMFYECDSSNCALGEEHCTNRAFGQLKMRHKPGNKGSKDTDDQPKDEQQKEQKERHKQGNKYNIGVEVMKTVDKGYGVRSCRTFEPGQIIVEYTGEIITQDECDHRMRTDYKENENMIIDATRGSIARFVNHSCQPNCKMVKWTVHGKPRMALFAGEDGIMTGEELTYDYNFDPFSAKNIQECHCGMPLCRGFLGPKPTKERADGSGKESSSSSGNPGAASASSSSAKRKLQGAMQEVKNKKRKLSADVSTLLSGGSSSSTSKAKREKENLENRAARAALRADIKSSRSARIVAAKLSRSKTAAVVAARTTAGKVTVKVGRKSTVVVTRDGKPVAGAAAPGSPKGKGKAKGKVLGKAAAAKTSLSGSSATATGLGRRGSIRRSVETIRSNVVRTIRGAGGKSSAGTKRGKSIKVVPKDDDDEEEEKEDEEKEELEIVVGGRKAETSDVFDVPA